jgi:hypothetical protein
LFIHNGQALLFATPTTQGTLLMRPNLLAGYRPEPHFSGMALTFNHTDPLVVKALTQQANYQNGSQSKNRSDLKVRIEDDLIVIGDLKQDKTPDDMAHYNALIIGAAKSLKTLLINAGNKEKLSTLDLRARLLNSPESIDD